MMLRCFIAVFITAASEPAQRLDSWSSGKASWQAARDAELWDQPNSCDPTVLKSSAPLTVLYALSSIWEKIDQRRKAEGSVEKPLEVHVLGSGYPFEGRSDWSMLSNQRPAEIPKVRVSLILGTPFQSDNVPPLHDQPNALLEMSQEIKPVSGKWSGRREEIICKGGGKWGTKDLDQGWSKEDLCRDHGNGLEVVCIEKFYQDVRDELPKPDLAVMFSPGFPQLGRRSWDDVLIGILNTNVPLMISDVVTVPKWGNELIVREFGNRKVLPGDKWDPSQEIGEEWQTWLAMSKYKAHRIKARRGPFPILHAEDGGILAKNGVVQIYQGYKPGTKPTQPVTEAKKNEYAAYLQSVDWKSVGSEECPGGELQKTFKFPTSRPFDNAVRDMYRSSFAEEARKRRAKLNDKQVTKLQELGLLKSDDQKNKPRRHWGLKAWVFVIKTLGCNAY